MTNDRLLEQRRLVAEQVAQVLASHATVTSILVFGSVATGTVDLFSDVDMLVICHPALISPLERTPLLTEVGRGWMIDVGTDNGLFAFVDEGGIVDGISVTVHYQRESWIETVVHEVLEQGAITIELLPFRPYTLLGLLQRGWLLYDANQQMERWREQIKHYPPLLKHNIVTHFAPILQEQTDELVATAQRKIGPRNFIFHLNRSIDALISILYALNDVYDPADRRAAQTIWPLLDYVPSDFVPRLTTVLEGPFDAEGMKRQADHYAELVREVMVEVNRLVDLR